jgi:hypothetical protein
VNHNVREHPIADSSDGPSMVNTPALAIIPLAMIT